MELHNVVTIDVETANPDQSSICQIGAVKWINGEKLTLSSLINPRTYFSDLNVSIHNINEADVLSSPTFSEFLPVLADFIGDNLIASYGAFDKSAINKTLSHYGSEAFKNEWLDISMVVRRTWPDKYSKNGYSLKNVSSDLGVKLEKHHDALSDALTAAIILKMAVIESNIDALQWCADLKKKRSRYNYPESSNEIPPANEDGPLFGEVVAFTGDLLIPRKDAQFSAANAGCVVKNSVTKKTTILVIGSPNFALISDKGKSIKQIKAEELASKGFPIRFMSESDFMSIVKN